MAPVFSPTLGLSKSEMSTYRQMRDRLEKKQYAKALKLADSLLKTSPDEAEILAFRAYTLSNMGPEKRQEAYDSVRLALRHKITNCICWEILGCLYRMDKDYGESLKCYKQASKLSPQNLAILKDLSMLQIQELQFKQFLDTRFKMLELESRATKDWAIISLAHYLCGDYDLSMELIKNAEKQMGTPSDEQSILERSEIILYQCIILEKLEKYQECLSLLESTKDLIRDTIAELEIKGRMFLKLGKVTKAHEVYKVLFTKNKDHAGYILNLLATHPDEELRNLFGYSEQHVSCSPDACNVACLINSNAVTSHGKNGIDWISSEPQQSILRRAHVKESQCVSSFFSNVFFHRVRYMIYEEQIKLLNYFNELTSNSSASEPLCRIVLCFLTDGLLLTQINQYLIPRLRKGVPSLRRVLVFCDSPQNRSIFLELLQKYEEALLNDSTFGKLTVNAVSNDTEPLIELPSTLMYTWTLMAEYFDFLEMWDDAICYIDKAIAHTPTYPSLYVEKARIMKHLGNTTEAARLCEFGRNLDLADRCINSKSAKYLLRDNQIENACDAAKKFSWMSNPDETVEMLCNSFELEKGYAYARRKDFGRAAKQFHAVMTFFKNALSDCYVFHSYCMYKMTYRSYIQFIDTMKVMLSNRYNRLAAKNAINLYFEIYDNKPTEVVKEPETEDAINVSKKKHKNKIKKDMKKVTSLKTPTQSALKDDDPDGSKLLQRDPMEAANQILRMSISYSNDDPETHVLAFEYAKRKGMGLLMLNSILRVWQLSGKEFTHRHIYQMLSEFCFKVSIKSFMEEHRPIIIASLQKVLGNLNSNFSNLSDLNQMGIELVNHITTLALQPNSGLRKITQGILLLTYQEGVNIETHPLLHSLLGSHDHSIQEYRESLRILSSTHGLSSVASKFRASCHKKFHLAVDFVEEVSTS